MYFRHSYFKLWKNVMYHGLESVAATEFQPDTEVAHTVGLSNVPHSHLHHYLFLDEAVITVHKDELKIKKDTIGHQPKVTVSAWTRVAQCPKPNTEHAPNAKWMREEGNDQQAMNVEEVTSTAGMNTQINEGRHVQGGAPAPINMPEDERLQKRQKQKDKEEINQLKAEAASLTDLVQQLLQRLDSMAGSEMPSPFPALR